MDAVDTAQQAQIDGLQANARFMFVMLLINLAASCAQIIECILVWKRGGGK